MRKLFAVIFLFAIALASCRIEKSLDRMADVMEQRHKEAP